MDDNFIYSNVTYSNMAQLMVDLKEKDEVEQICKEYSLNVSLLRDLFLLAAQGFNNAQVAQKLGVHRVTIQRYSYTLRNMEPERYKRLFNLVTGGKV